jgi:hypothetical protein
MGPQVMITRMAGFLAYAAAAIVALWGAAHAIPTRQVLAGFEPITTHNRRVVLQEWLAEAFTMWGIAAVVVSVTIVDHARVTLPRPAHWNSPPVNPLVT